MMNKVVYIKCVTAQY